MKKLLLLISIMPLFFMACKNNEDTSFPDKGKASLTVRLGGQTIGKAKPETRAVGIPTQVEENQVLSFMVYVFNNSRLEKSVLSTTRGDLFIDNLTTGTKKIVVITNALSYPDLDEGDPYQDLAAVANNIDLGEQQSLNNGLIMTGEITTTLQSESLGTNERTVPVSRIVAKIKLGSITVDPAIGTDILKFSVSGVAVIKAKGKSSYGIPAVVTSNPFYSGIEGLTVHGTDVKTYLYESCTIASHSNRYFYTFANDTADDEESTLLAIEGNYDGETMYYPFRVKNIKSNTEYVINVTLRRIGSGSPDPEIPSDPATLSVTVEPVNWVLAPVQNMEW